MNRLVIIGNGFDLAHGLPTGYCDFIDWYWRKVIKNVKFPIYDNSFNYTDKLINIQFQFNADFYLLQEIRGEFEVIKNFAEFNEFILKYTISDQEVEYLEFYPNKIVNNCKLNIHNSFFKIINDRKQIQNWVDIENEYYKLLKDCLREENNKEVKKLNTEFEQIKNLLEEYLYTKIEQSKDFTNITNFEKLSDIFKISQLFLDANPDCNYLKEFPQSDHEDLTSFDNQLLQAIKTNKSLEILNEITNLKRNLFLNFNYTPSIKSHMKNFINTDTDFYGTNKVIYIHGRLNDKNNPINFGFGDEMDNHYKLIEEKEDNEYLKNIKSFQYLQNSNYKDLLDFIDSEKFQVYIMGHSCGLSDRILLNTIFEHTNCRSIKVFYYQKGDWDNYTDIVQNISRHFNKKKMMRDKIVNKSLCQPLPQDIRFAPK